MNKRDLLLALPKLTAWVGKADKRRPTVSSTRIQEYTEKESHEKLLGEKQGE